MRRRWIPEWTPCWLNNALCDVADLLKDIAAEPLRIFAAVCLLLMLTAGLVLLIIGLMWLFS